MYNGKLINTSSFLYSNNLSYVSLMNLEKSMRYLLKQFFRKDKQYTMLQNSQQSTDIIIPKPHAHIIMTQMNVCKGIKKFGEKAMKPY